MPDVLSSVYSDEAGHSWHSWNNRTSNSGHYWERDIDKGNSDVPEEVDTRIEDTGNGSQNILNIVGKVTLKPTTLPGASYRKKVLSSILYLLLIR